MPEPPLGQSNSFGTDLAKKLLRTLIVFAFAIAIGAVTSLVVCLTQWLQQDNARRFFLSLDGMRMQFGIVLILLFAIVVVVVLARPSFRSLSFWIACFAILCLGTSKLVRLDGFNGDRTPKLAWRWTPPAEETIKNYLVAAKSNRLDPIAPALTLPTKYDFPGFMGPDRNGTIGTIHLADNWEQNEPRVLWRHPVGLGWSSFAVMGQMAVNLEQREQEECVVCYHAQTGEELWCHREQDRFHSEHGDGPRSTPTIYEGRVFSMGGRGILTCIELASGTLQWRKDLLNDPAKENLYFGMTCSPLVFEEMVIVTPGAGIGGAAIAFSAATGDEIWRNGDDFASYASPIQASLGGVRQILSFNGAGLRTYSLEGKPLLLHPWETQGESRVNVAQPVVIETQTSEASEARILISSGYDMGTALLRVFERDGRWESEEVWKSSHLKSKLSNFVVFDNHIYGLDNGLLTCLRLSDGKREWKKGRYGHGQLLLVQDKLLIQSEPGDIVLVEATPKGHHELTRFAALSDKTWNHPTLAGNLLIVRNDREAAAYILPTE